MFDLIEKSYGIDDHQVTIMLKAEDSKGKEFIKMIGYHNKDDRSPGSFKRGIILTTKMTRDIIM